MTADKIDPSSTLADVWWRISGPDAYAADIMGSMHKLRPRGEDVVVRIGVTGTGQRPNYRVEDQRGELASIAYDGATHLPFPDKEQSGATRTWSTQILSYQDVADLRVARKASRS